MDKGNSVVILLWQEMQVVMMECTYQMMLEEFFVDVITIETIKS